MSKYCGKCDFADHLEICGTDKPMKVYIADEEVDCSTEAKRALYYPYIIAALFSNPDGQTIYITHLSYIRLQELETIDHIMDKLLVAYRRCKRKKIEFSFDEATSKLYSLYLREPYDKLTRQIYERIKANPKEVRVDDLRIGSVMNVYHRKEWFEELVRLGWDKDVAEDWVMNY